MEKSKIYLDVATKMLKGERWRDVPGYEGSYMVSNLGRVKSVSRVVLHKRCGTQFVAGRVLRQHVKKHCNHFTKDYVIILQVTLTAENEPHDFVVRRLVYAAFRDVSLLGQPKRMIVAKDGDGFNNRLSNLLEVNNRETQKMVIAKGRMFQTLSHLDHRTFKPTYALWIPVHKCDLDGNILQTYPSIAMAARSERLYEKGITNTAKGKQDSYKGFTWKYADRKSLQRFIAENHS